MAAIVELVLRLAPQVPVVLVLMAAVGATEIAISAASTRSATGMAATAAIVLRLVRRVIVVPVRRRMAMVGPTEIATPAASTRRAIGMAAIAAIFLRLVT